MLFYFLLCTTLSLNSAQKTDSMGPITKLPTELLAKIASFNTTRSGVNCSLEVPPSLDYVEARHQQIKNLIQFSLVSKPLRNGAFTLALDEFTTENEQKLCRQVLRINGLVHKALSPTKNVSITQHKELRESIGLKSPYIGNQQWSLPRERLFYRKEGLFLFFGYEKEKNTIVHALGTPWRTIVLSEHQADDHIASEKMNGALNNALSTIPLSLIGRYRDTKRITHLHDENIYKADNNCITNRGNAANHLIFRAMENSCNEECQEKMTHINDVVDNLLPVKDVRDMAVDYIDFLEN